MDKRVTPQAPDSGAYHLLERRRSRKEHNVETTIHLQQGSNVIDLVHHFRNTVMYFYMYNE
jgi:hypothetical protein